MYTSLYALAMITTLMPYLRIGPYKEGVIIDQIQMPFHAIGRSFPYELLYKPIHILVAILQISKLRVDVGQFPYVFYYYFIIMIYNYYLKIQYKGFEKNNEKYSIREQKGKLKLNYLTQLIHTHTGISCVVIVCPVCITYKLS